MEKYNETMYKSLMEYVCTHADKITDVETIRKYVEACKKNPTVSYEYSGVYADPGRDTQDFIDLIDKPMEEWFNVNGLSYPVFFAESNANSGWMVRHIPNTYAYLFHHLLIDVAKHQHLDIDL